jgi:FAS-associated factor 2
MPQFFDGSFTEAVQSARQQQKLLVVYLHSEHSSFTRSFCTRVLSSEIVRSMLDASFILWGGDAARMETLHVAAMMHSPQFQYPCLCVLLPANPDDIRAIGAVHGQVQVDAAVALLTAGLEEMNSHQALDVARRAQHAEDRSLREQQDREYQEALAADQMRIEQQRAQEREELEAQRKAEEQRRLEEAEKSRLEATARDLQARRKRQAEALDPERADATARIAVRLPAGSRLQRKFSPNATLEDVYLWAECAAYLPENIGLELQIPPKFSLRTSFPPRDFARDGEEVRQSLQDLQLVGGTLLLVEIEDDHEQTA